MTIDVSKYEIQMKKGVIEYVILSIIGKSDSYSSDILQILQDNNLIVVEGTLYPLLSRMKNDGLISYYWQESQYGPPRKYFKITQKGKDLLEQLDKIWKNMNLSIDAILNL